MNLRADFSISKTEGVVMGEKGKKDKSRREDKKKPKLTIKEKRKLKKEKKKEKWN
ncbi:MAG: hypothetical protein IIC78_14190 [Chloroflexi bacterium]|nr:hypothetical protein [Chloroflexota bacterium]